jgi:hypothetical protein
MDHDRLFKELLGTFFLEFIRLFLPDVALYLDPDLIEFVDKQTFTDVTRGEKHEADLVVKTRFRGQAACFLVHIENQASPQQKFGKRMFRYFARLYEKFDMPICPVAIFSYDRPRRGEPSTFEVALPHFRVMAFQFKTIVLNQLNWRDFVEHPNPVAAALMAKMNIAPEDRPRVKLECLRMIATLKLDPARVRLLSGFVDSYLRLDAAEQQVFALNLEEAGLAEKEDVMEIVTSWMEEGIEKGLALGREEGLEEGRETALDITLQFLTRQVGALLPDAEAAVRALSLADLRRLGAALVEFRTAADLDAWLSAR